MYPPEIYRSTIDVMRCIACNFDGYKAQTDALDARDALDAISKVISLKWMQAGPSGAPQGEKP